MRILISFAVSAAMGLVGCSISSTNANSSPNPGPGNSGSNANSNPNPGVSNSSLEQSVKSKIAADPQTASANLDVTADASKNQVTLSGAVYSEGVRTEAVNDAKDVQSGLAVVDQIQVRPGDIPRSAYTEDTARQAREKAQAEGDKIGTSLEDAWIHTKVEAKLIANSEARTRKIHVDVQNGVVTLRGNVDSASEKAEAGRAAMNMQGVKRVNNLLHVG